jgi:hypothetical protein
LKETLLLPLGFPPYLLGTSLYLLENLILPKKEDDKKPYIIIHTSIKMLFKPYKNIELGNYNKHLTHRK